MAQWVRLCGLGETPAEGKLTAAEAGAQNVCLARVDGVLSAVENVCPHRQAPLAEGWIEDRRLVCPWHSWSFDVKTGLAEYPPGEKVRTFAVELRGDDVYIDLEGS